MLETIQVNEQYFFFGVGSSYRSTSKLDSYYDQSTGYTPYTSGSTGPDRYSNNQNVEYFIYVAEVQESSQNSDQRFGSRVETSSKTQSSNGLDFSIAKKLKLNFVTAGIDQVDFKVRRNIALLFRWAN